MGRLKAPFMFGEVGLLLGKPRTATLVAAEPAFVVKIGAAAFRKAFDAIPALPCQGCTAGCFTEYNYLYGLDGACLWDWMRAMMRR